MRAVSVRAPAEVGVVIIHGMGDPESAFALPLIEGLSRLLGADAKAVAFEPCFWSDLLQNGQDEIWRRLQDARSPMNINLLRKWVVGTLGDPTGYLSGYERQGIPLMHRVHQRFADSLARVEARLADPARAPVVVLAHSLGCVVVTNYLWNLERAAGEVGTSAVSALHPAAREVARKAIGDTPVQRLETLTGLITFGCNIPLFLPPAPPYECVRFPRPRLAESLKRVARWLNVYDPYDILGYPLSGLWDETHGTTIEDVAMEVGMPGLSMTPLSHTFYWTDGGFQALVGGELKRMLAVS
ncbi:MAG: hypothetical protein ACREN6_13090 [Gemmatimonadaceae bacterium]